MDTPLTEDDSFVTTVVNQTSIQLVSSGNSFQYGDFDTGTSANPIEGNSSPKAFSVQGSGASGVQGSITYIVDTDTQLVFLFNSNVGGTRGAYFYACLQPRETGQDPTSYYATVSNFSPFDGDATAFTPTATVGMVAQGLDVTPMSAVFDWGYVMIDIWISNNTTGIMTLNNVTAPLDSDWQPALAQAIPPLTTALLLTTYYMIKVPLAPNLAVTYNIPGAGQVTFGMPAKSNYPDGPVGLTFGGNADVSYYAANPAGVEYKNSDGQTDAIKFTLTVAFGLQFVVEIDNQTTAQLDGTSSSFSAGELLPGTSLASVAPNSTALAFQAVGSVQPVGGVTGSVTFSLGGQVTLELLINSNAGGAPGWYVYPCLQGAGADPTGFVVQMTGMPVLAAGAPQAMFTPTVTLAPSSAATIATLSQVMVPPGATATIIDITVDNQSGGVMTLQSVTSPLNVPWQPAFAPAVASGASTLLMSAGLVGVDLTSAIDVTYNLTGDTQVVLTLPANSSGSAPSGAVAGSFTGSNPSGFTFTAAAPTSSTNGAVTTYTLSITIATA